MRSPLFKTRAIGQHKILDFDIENRPLSYMGSDYTSAEVTAIAWSWLGQEKVHVRLLSLDPASVLPMLEDFVTAYDRADVVTGHYIRRHDLPIINGALLEYDYPPLTSKLVSDTKVDLLKHLELPASQEALATMYGLPDAKKHMSQTEWRQANRLTPEGLRYTRKRVVDDVIQHKALRNALLDAGALKTPQLWTP